MKTTIAELLHEKEILISRLNKMIYGSIEIRSNNEKKYIYVHYKLDGISQTKYAGEYSNELYVILQVYFEKITVSKRIKDYIRSFERTVFFCFLSKKLSKI